MCINCYNGCTEIISDKCVRYTGIDVPLLSIKSGDPLCTVEQKIISFLLTTLNGTGIKFNLNEEVLCNVVEQFLPTCNDITIIDISNAFSKAICNLQEQIDVLKIKEQALNSEYQLNCLPPITDNKDTHKVLQATINKLCSVAQTVTNLVTDLANNYVKKSEINTYITQYNVNQGSSKYQNRMVPHSAIPWFGDPTGKFDSTGKGIVGTDWEKIYLCNGANTTPDMRGVVPAGLTDGKMLGGNFATVVDPSDTFNPKYELSKVYGTNKVTLSTQQIPSHTHTATAVSTVTDPEHSHTGKAAGPYIGENIGGGFAGSNANGFKDRPFTTDKAKTGITVDTSITNASTGGGLPHSNNQPTIGCYYIIYIP